METITIPAENLTPCKGDWMQRGCATGKASVHRVTTHGNTRDCCAFHSPFDVTPERPAGSEIRPVPPTIDEILALL